METTGYPECEKRRVFRLLIFVAGFFGGYTLAARGGVFCNAQTANMALFAVGLSSGDWGKAGYYLIPMGAYFLGVVISEFMPRRLHRLRWGTLLILTEILTVIVLGFLPVEADRICHVAISFLCAMQHNTFRLAEGTPMATIFCTLHFRQFSSGLARWLRGDPGGAKQAADHGWMIFCFILGALAAAIACRVLDTAAIWCAAVPLAILFADLLHADLTEKAEKVYE